MGLSGNLLTMALPEVLQWISTGSKTGTLHLERASIEKRIFFRAGRIASSWSNNPRESLGQFLVREGQLSEQQLFDAMLRQENEGRLFGAIVVGDGLLGAEALRATLARKASEAVYDLFLWPDGSFEFREGELPEHLEIVVDLAVTGVLLEGIRRVDELQRIREVFPSTRTTFRLEGAPDPADDGTTRRAVTLVAAGKSLGEIALELRRSEFEGAALLFGLYQKGRLAVDDPGEQVSDAETLTRIGALLGDAGARMASGDFDGALAAYEQVLSLDRLNQHAKKGLVKAIDGRVRQQRARNVPLDGIPVLARELATMTGESFDAQEGFVLSRINGEWDTQSILKLCPMPEEDVLQIFGRLLERHVIRFDPPT